MTGHVLMTCGEWLLAVSLAMFLIALVERAREQRAAKIPVRSREDERR